jgi:hypothetical protein
MDLAAMTHSSEKSKYMAWRRGAGCDREEASGFLSLRYQSCQGDTCL